MNYLGMDLGLDPLDADSQSYFAFCARREFRLQQCGACGLLRFPPGPRCQACTSEQAEWTAVQPEGHVYSHTVVHQATNPFFKAVVPYAVLLVELDAQPHAPLRIPGNLAHPDGRIATVAGPRDWDIGTRVTMTFAFVHDILALPMWTLSPPLS